MGIKAKIKDFKAWWNNMTELKQEPVAVPEPLHEHHICSHCGYGYDGRCCPQCGMPAGHVRFTFKRLIQNFLDIWGLGNRPMFRTIRDLLWRPGYMIRDYLDGHHLSYFPPFKMLAVLTVFIILLMLLFHIQSNNISIQLAKAIDQLKGTIKSQLLIDIIKNTILFFGEHDLYRILAQNVFVVLAAWIVFYKKGYNLVETAFSQIYINCQFHLIAIVWILFTWQLPPSEFFPYFVPSNLAFIMLVYDYKQLYGLTIKKSIKKTIAFSIVTVVLYILAFILVVSLVALFDWLFTSSALNEIQDSVANIAPATPAK